MTTSRLLRGIELRYVLTNNLGRHGPATIPSLIETLHYQGFSVAGRASKAVSDALRWEMRRGRVRLRRGFYGPGSMPRSTEEHVNKRAMALRAEAALMAAHDASFWDALGA